MALEEGPQHKATLEAVVLDHVELGEYPRGPRDNATCAQQLVEVELPVMGRREGGREGGREDKDRRGRGRRG